MTGSRAVDLDPSSLQEILGELQRGLRVENLILVGLALEDGATVDKTREKQEKIRTLLTELLTRIKTNVHGANISSLLLQVAYVSSSGQRRLPCEAPLSELKTIWQAAIDTLNVVCSALDESVLQVAELNIFNNANMRRCSLSCHVLAQVDWSRPGIKRALSAVRTLSISLSNRIIDERPLKPSADIDMGSEEEEEGSADGDDETDVDGDDPDDDESENDEYDDFDDHDDYEETLRDIVELQAEADNPDNFTGFSQLLRHCTQLESLDWHYFKLRNGPLASRPLHHEKLLQTVVRDCGLRRLHSCTLRGVIAGEEDLLVLLRQALPASVTFKAIRLCSGAWRPILDLFANASNGVEALHLEDLEERRLVMFDIPGRPKITLTGSPRGCNLLTRSGVEVRQHVSYHVPQGHRIGAPNNYAWASEQREEYGPR